MCRPKTEKQTKPHCHADTLSHSRLICLEALNMTFEKKHTFENFIKKRLNICQYWFLVCHIVIIVDINIFQGVRALHVVPVTPPCLMHWWPNNFCIYGRIVLKQRRNYLINIMTAWTVCLIQHGVSRECLTNVRACTKPHVLLFPELSLTTLNLMVCYQITNRQTSDV